MRHFTWLSRAGAFGVLGAALLMGGSVWADDGPAADEQKESSEKDEELKDAGSHERIRERRVVVMAPSKYWLGVEVAPISSALNEQLDLKGEGLLIREVAADSPADKGGIKVNDILVSIAGQPIKRASELSEAVGKSEGKPLEFKLVHAGKPTTVTITPSELPEGQRKRNRDVDREELEVMVREHIKRAENYARDKRAAVEGEVMEKAKRVETQILEKLKHAGVDLRLEFVEPGRVFPPGKGFHFGMTKAELPDDLSVTVRKQGKNAAEIDVKKGDQTWNIKENELDKLPDDVRKHVQGMLGGGPIRFNVVTDHPPVPGVPAVAPTIRHAPKPPTSPKAPQAARRPEFSRSSVEQRLKEMNGRLEQMHRQMEELQKSLREEADKNPDDESEESGQSDGDI